VAVAVKYKNVESISRGLLLDLVEKIEVYDAEGTGKNRIQKVDVHFKFIGKML
jgi:hypothetical protein